jgi:lycopene cyclase domain-containing protein
MEQYTYLLINFCSLLVPFILSFESRIGYYKKWKYLFPAMTATAVFFIVWDSIFTANGVWGFNPKFVTGINVFNLPLEEILFFFCIPYSSIFAYEALGLVQNLKVRNPKIITLVIFSTCIAGAFLFHDKAYTFYTCLFLGIFLLLQLVWIKGEYLARFYFAYMIILIPFTIVNGLLTGSWIGEPVVWYNNDENLAVRFLTIPVEDVFYGMLMLGMSVSIYESLKTKKGL